MWAKVNNDLEEDRRVQELHWGDFYSWGNSWISNDSKRTVLKNLYKHSVDIISNTIYATGELSGTKLYLVAEGCVVQPWRPAL